MNQFDDIEMVMDNYNLSLSEEKEDQKVESQVIKTACESCSYKKGMRVCNSCIEFKEV